MVEQMPILDTEHPWDLQEYTLEGPIGLGWDLVGDEGLEAYDDTTYWTESKSLSGVAKALSEAVNSSTSFAEVCMKMAPHIAKDVEVSGIDNIPTQGPLIVIKNHPCHFDSLLLGGVFGRRSDVRSLTKVSFLTDPLPDDYVIRLRKEGARANPDDAYVLKTYLQAGGSLMAVPWGAMDHQAKGYANLDRTIQNVLRYASFSDATIVPVTIDSTWDGSKSLPLGKAIIQIGEPLRPSASAADLLHTTEVVADLYERYARAPEN
jgi:Acyltransferase